MGGLNNNQKTLLAKMRLDNKSSKEPYIATSFWQRVNSSFSNTFKKKGVDLKSINRQYAGLEPDNENCHKYATYLYYQALAKRDNFDKLKGIPAARHSKVYSISKGTYSYEHLFSIDDILNVAEAEPRILYSNLIVADIGAGWGRIGYVLKKANPQATYVVFDLPESLLVAMTVLPKLLPNHIHRDYQQAKEITAPLSQTVLRQAGIWYLGTQDLDRTSSNTFDVVFCIANFQEMTQEQVKLYFDIIDTKASGGWLYLKQKWESVGREGCIRGYQEYPFKKYWKQMYLRNARTSQEFFETIFRLHPSKG